jgi:hypothetical protein
VFSGAASSFRGSPKRFLALGALLLAGTLPLLAALAQPGTSTSDEVTGLTARSELLQALAEWGFLGLGGLLLVMSVAAWLARRTGDRVAAALLVVAAITMIGESILAEPASTATLWLALGFCFGAIGFRGGARPDAPVSDGETRNETSPPKAIPSMSRTHS